LVQLESNNKKEIISWITPECFLDVDIPIIIGLNKLYKINWLIIGFDRSHRGMYTRLDIENIILENGIQGEILQQNYRFSNPLVLSFYFKVTNRITKLKPSLVYTSYLGEPFFLLLLPCFIKKSKVVIAYHDVIMHTGERYSSIKNIYHTICRQLFTNIHLFSNTQKEIFTKKYGNKNMLTTPLVCKDFGKPINIKESTKIRFLFFGSIAEYKGLDVLLNAVNYLIDELKENNFLLTIAGNANHSEWNNYKKLISHAEQINCDIRIIPNSEIPDLFCNNDILILPYKEATQSGPLMIAYNYGIPIIASNLLAFQEYITNRETGLFFQNHSHKELASVMKECINNAKLVSDLKNNVKATSQTKFGFDYISNQYIKYFNKFLG
jgi:glycosyltransferase involved in cell wall biosynthesis